MKLKNKLLKDISTRLEFSTKESYKRSLKILIRLKLISYLSILNNLSKLNKKLTSVKEKNRCFITSRSSGNFAKISLEWSEGGVPVPPWRTLRANADCSLFVFPLYWYPFYDF